MQYDVIMNPAAGGGGFRRKRRRLERALQRQQLSYVLSVSEHPDHVRELACDAARRGHAVVAAGGDGTVQQVAQGLRDAGGSVPMGVVPMGTGNDFVKAVGIPFATQEAVDVLADGGPVPVDCGQVCWNTTADEGQRIFVNALGVGFDARVAAAVTRFKRLPGTSAYLAAVLSSLRDWSAPQVRIESENGILYDNTLLFATFANGVSSGGGFYLTPSASPQDGQLDMCLIEAISLRRILMLIPSVLRGSHGAASEVHMDRVRRVEITAEEPLPVHADGEPLTVDAHRLTVEVVSEGLSVLVPAPDNSAVAAVRQRSAGQ